MEGSEGRTDGRKAGGEGSEGRKDGWMEAKEGSKGRKDTHYLELEVLDVVVVLEAVVSTGGWGRLGCPRKVNGERRKGVGLLVVFTC
jgi:hypothetical protein